MLCFLKKYLFLFIFLFNYSYANQEIQIELFLFDNVAYFSLEEFCNNHNYKFTKYSDKSKIGFFIQDKQITFSLNSSFVKIDNKIYHMIKNVRFINDIYYIPLNSFIRLYSQFVSYNFIVDYVNNKINISEKSIEVMGGNELKDPIKQEVLNEINKAKNWKISTSSYSKCKSNHKGNILFFKNNTKKYSNTTQSHR